jgi:hypothetical protein
VPSSRHGLRLKAQALVSFPQNEDEISTCGNRLLMNFSDAPESPKTGRISPEKIFGKKS